MIAYCGLKCETCPIYLATREKDREKQRQMRESIVRQILKEYGMQCRVEDITDCDGCPTQGGRLFAGCRKCRIRPCARERGLENCAHCSDYACDKLKEFFNFGGKLVNIDAKKQLDAIRKSL
jgi:Protein of unknown function (DUF3795)